VTVTPPPGEQDIEEQITVQYATDDGFGAGWATDGDNDGGEEDYDFNETFGALHFFPGDPEHNLTLEVYVWAEDDNRVEPNEVMRLYINDNIQNAVVVGQDWADGTIYNDDVEVTLVHDIEEEDEGPLHPRYWVNGAATVLAHAGFEIELVGSTSNGSAETADYTPVDQYDIDVSVLATQQNPLPLATVTINNDVYGATHDEDLETIIYSVSVGDDTTDGLDVHVISYTCTLTIDDDEQQ
jgi:hypothetical protein